MNRSDSPKKQPKPFGVNGQRGEILPTTPAGDNSASYEQGFPPITMILKSAGGLPPKGQDMNQILYELSALGRWSSTGALNTFDSEFASEISGYPSGAMLISDDGERIFINTTEGNLSDPNSNGTGWKDVLSYLGLGDGTGRLIAVYRIDTSRQITLPKDARFVVADIIGGGGGGGSNSTTVQPGYASAGQGGNSGSRVVAKFTVDASQKINITIGAGGAGGVPTPATGADGSDGGATIIDGITATGGRGGAKGAAFNVLPTGGPTAIQNANNTIPGGAELIAQHHGYGGSSGFLFSDKNALGGKGADSEFGVGGVAVGISSGVNASTGKNATGNGSGGSGAVSIYGSGSTGVSMSGGAGVDGLAILWVYG
ncbi:hypothetical protein FEZ20_004084 [Escherichia coli]|nr:hypothetical protein [Escherichia coli]EGO7974162.1 hypothetical protein [Escherichia coli]EGO7979705.1 hypothetical protein [Escherichia coli]EGO8001888.1 hypothetical protein [Escherichia coli]